MSPNVACTRPYRRSADGGRAGRTGAGLAGGQAQRVAGLRRRLLDRLGVPTS
ncbi:hypothetical protein ACNTMW_31860 [Planosporangium sp. 12N6]|uniref:hypothetical protein n=1 Tax=Planosporangium spinosum TaxID=3402278 RepID=UPI003CEAFB1D